MATVPSPDGLPVVDPTRERVERFLEAADVAGEDRLGPFPLSERSATMETLAANAVMAGCEASSFPVVLAALEASLEPEFNLYGTLATTEPHWPMVVVNGPIVEELDINGGANAFGQGSKANATIGRALTFVYMNVAGATPGPTDKATHGGPHKFGLCVAENEAESPWEPLGVERGFEEDDSTVTVLTTEAPHNINDHVADSAAGVLTTAANSMAVLGANTTYLSERAEPCLALSPEHAATIARDGYSKDDVKRFVYDHARVPHEELRDQGMYDTRDGSRPRHVPASELDDDAGVPICRSPEAPVVFVAGGAGRHSLFLSSFGDSRSVTCRIR
ncbi:hypothetical protein [Natronomonas gomsonensis]|uniref:hypothetical protein n=1 Tax=Natronomonas gomsonensis TaxID=1046043 RepID=UPI001FE2C413|nr:hypothetical protein [Natronomonas gomsonensis]